jgi:hypothetical protein
VQVSLKAEQPALAHVFAMLAEDCEAASERQRKSGGNGLVDVPLPSGLSPDHFLTRLSGPLCEAFFPKHVKSACGQLMVLLQTMSEVSQKKAVLQLLASWLKHSNLVSCGVLYWHGASSLFAPVAKLVESPLAADALAVLDLLMTNGAKPAGTGDLSAGVDWRQPVPWAAQSSHELAVTYLGSVIDSFGSAGAGRQQLDYPILPFLPLA